MKFGALLTAGVGDVVRLADDHSKQTFRVLQVRDLESNPLKPDTYRRRKENLRSKVYAKLFNVATRRLQTRYFAENIRCEIVATSAEAASVKG